MRFRPRARQLVLAVSVLALMPADAAQPDFSSVDRAALIVIGRVTAAEAAWDTRVDLIYTSTRVEVREVIKGWLPARTLDVKQLGGSVGAVTLRVVEQPLFRTGEDVLLLLDVRPRDGSLYMAFPDGITWTPRDADRVRARVRDTIGPAAVRPSTGIARLSPADIPSGGTCPGAFHDRTSSRDTQLDTCGEVSDVGAAGALRGQWSIAGTTFLEGFIIANAAPVEAGHVRPLALVPTPSGVQAVLSRAQTLLTVSFTAVPGVILYRADFRQSTGGPVLQSLPTTLTTFSVEIPPQVNGTFMVQITAITPLGESDPSAPAVFQLGRGGTCTEPPDPPTGGEGYVEQVGPWQAVAHVWWDPLDEEAQAFHVRAYDLVHGNAQIFNQNVGLTRRVDQHVGPGFRARVEVFAVNVCGESGPLVILVQ